MVLIGMALETVESVVARGKTRGDSEGHCGLDVHLYTRTP